MKKKIISDIIRMKQIIGAKILSDFLGISYFYLSHLANETMTLTEGIETKFNELKGKQKEYDCGKYKVIIKIK